MAFDKKPFLPSGDFFVHFLSNFGNEFIPFGFTFGFPGQYIYTVFLRLINVLTFAGESPGGVGTSC